MTGKSISIHQIIRLIEPAQITSATPIKQIEEAARNIIAKFNKLKKDFH